MNFETKPEIEQVNKKERYCFACDTKVTYDAEVCSSCKKVLYSEGRSQKATDRIGYVWGFVLGVIAAFIVGFFGAKIGKFNSSIPATITGGAVFFIVWQYKKGKLEQRRDLAIWKSDVSSVSSPAQNTQASSKEDSL